MTALFFGISAWKLGLFSGADAWLPLPLVVILAGTLGGFISGLSRLYSLRWAGDILWTGPT